MSAKLTLTDNNERHNYSKQILVCYLLLSIERAFGPFIGCIIIHNIEYNLLEKN